MPPSTNPYQYISIKDFSAGISDNPGSNYPNGAAQRDGTFRCIANRSGALVPLPKRTQPFSMPHEGGTGSEPIAVVGLYAPPVPLLPTVLAFQPDQFPEHELMIGIERLTGGTRYNKLFRVRRYETPGTLFDTIKNVNAADASPTFRPSGMGFGTTRSNRVTPTLPGVPVVIAMWVTGSAFMYLSEFPDDQAPTTNTPYDIFSNTEFLLGICTHQGRVIAQLATAYSQGVDTATFMGENLIWSHVNDVTTANWNTATPQVFVPENPAGFGFVIGMTANELFAVKGSAGAMYVSGDVVSPTVVTLPMVTGTDISHTPVASKLGVVYGNRTSGVWLWPHGDTSELLSPQMNPDFWAVTPGNDFDDFGGVSYQFAHCDEWVLLPNNWIYDTQLRTWWRLEDPDLMQFRFMTCMSHFIYGSESYYTNDSDTPIHEWVRENKALSYSWQSQPQWESVGNLVDIREITMRATGEGTVKVTCTGESMTQTVIFQINSTLPVLRRQNIRIQDANIAVKIESSGEVEAPTVYEVNLGKIQTQLETVNQ